MIHAAGALHDGMLVRQQWSEFEKGLGAKVHGTWQLHRATQRMSLVFFVCYLSVASVIGSPGQGSYAAANAFMDSLAYAPAGGRPARVVDLVGRLAARRDGRWLAKPIARG